MQVSIDDTMRMINGRQSKVLFNFHGIEADLYMHIFTRQMITVKCQSFLCSSSSSCLVPPCCLVLKI